MGKVSGRYIRRAVPLTIGIVAVLTWPTTKWLGDSAFWGLAVGGVVSAVVVSISFSALAWSFDKSNRAFMITYVAGFLGRIAILSGSILVFSQIESLDTIAATIAMLFVYLALTALEIKQINSYRSIQ